jgi:hypothetical protein
MHTEKELIKRTGLRIPTYPGGCKDFGEKYNKLKGCKKCKKDIKMSCYKEKFKNFRVFH